MDQGKPSCSNSRNSRRQRSASTSNLIQNHAAREHADGSGVSAQDAALLAQFAFSAENLDQVYPSTLSQGYYPPMAPSPGFYGNFLHHDNMPPQSSSSPTPVNFPWHINTALSRSKPSTNQNDVPRASSSHPGPLSFLDSPRASLHPSDATSINPTREQQAQVLAVASYNSQEVEFTEAERAAVSDEKRRRNTAASARFRVKKKHRTIALERTVSDLTGRAEELAREVGDLRRENGWLKEIVMLKGTQNIANNRLALRQAFATGQHMSGTESTLQEGVSEGLSSLSDDETPVKQSKDQRTKNASS